MGNWPTWILPQKNLNCHIQTKTRHWPIINNLQNFWQSSANMTFKNIWRLSNYWKKKNLQILKREKKLSKMLRWGFLHFRCPFFHVILSFWRFSRPTTNLECIPEAFDTPLHFEEDTWIVDWDGRHHPMCFCSCGPNCITQRRSLKLNARTPTTLIARICNT